VPLVSVPLASNTSGARPTLRQVVLERLHEVLARAKPVPKRGAPTLAGARHTRRVAIIVIRRPEHPSHAAAIIVVRPEHPAHNRRHLAAARGEAQLR
jgi:hypothetical protein